MKTITNADEWRFSFTVTDLARFLGKAPVTIRGWERQGLIKLPRDSGGDRKLNVGDIYKVALVARQLNRITQDRLRLIDATLLLIRQIEKANNS